MLTRNNLSITFIYIFKILSNQKCPKQFIQGFYRISRAELQNINLSTNALFDPFQTRAPFGRKASQNVQARNWKSLLTEFKKETKFLLYLQFLITSISREEIKGFWNSHHPLLIFLMTDRVFKFHNDTVAT